MGTSGRYGIKKNGRTKATYNHYDSYFIDGLGNKMMEFISRNKNRLDKFFDSIILVYEGDNPEKEVIEWAVRHNTWNTKVSDGKDYYSILRECQGNFELYEECMNNNEPIYMLYCGNEGMEHDYLIDLDSNTFSYVQDHFGYPDTTAWDLNVL